MGQSGQSNPAPGGRPAPRRPYGSGGLRQVRPNVWELRVATGGRNRFSGKYGEISRTFLGTKLEAEEELDRLRSAARSARNRRVPNAMASDLFDAYLEWLERQMRLGAKSPTTIYKSYEPKIRKHLEPQLGRYRLRQLQDGSLINELYDAMLDEDWVDGQLSRSNLASIHRVLSAVLGWGLKQGWLGPDEDPRRLIDPPHVRRSIPTPCSPEEAILLLEAAAASRRPEMERLIFLGLVGGMRLGECCALRRNDIDWTAGRVKVQRSVIDIPGRRGEEKDTKNHRNRDVYFDPVALAVLRNQADFVEDRAAVGAVELVADYYLWSNSLDGSSPLLPKAVGQYFQRLRDRVNLPHVNFKSLRSFMQTQTEDAGFPVSAAAARGGHDPAVLVRHYSQAQAETQRRISAALTGLIHREDEPGTRNGAQIVPLRSPV
jgi:integrase